MDFVPMGASVSSGKGMKRGAEGGPSAPWLEDQSELLRVEKMLVELAPELPNEG